MRCWPVALGLAAALAGSPGPARPDEPPAGTGQSAADQGLDRLVEGTRAALWRDRWNAVNALGNLGDVRAVPALAERALHDENPHPRWRALWAISVIDGGADAAMPLFREAGASGDPGTARRAAIALAFFRREEAREPLIRGLADEDAFNRWEAAFSLRGLGSPAVTRALAARLDPSVEPSVRVRGEAALALGYGGDPAAIGPLVDALRGDPAPDVRWRAALGLARVADRSHAPALDDALANEPDERVRERLQATIRGLRPRPSTDPETATH